MEIQLTATHNNNILWAIGTVIFIAVTSILLGYLAKLVAKVFRNTPADQNRVFWGFTFAGPWIVGFIIFVVGPATASLLYSFTDYRIGDPFNFLHYQDFWVELKNYRMLLLGEGRFGRLFKQALFNSFYYTLIGVPLQIVASLAMAMLLNRQMRGIRTFRTIYYLPVILAASPAALLAWRYMLTSNGGFVNNSLRRFADTFFVFDYIYRGFIYIVEGFNGFFEGVAKGDPVGPYKFALPALLGLFALLTLLGDWDKSKRRRAWTIGEILAVIVLGNMMSGGLMKTPVNHSWTYVAGIVLGGLVLANARANKFGFVRTWQTVGLGVFGISLYLTLQKSGWDFSNAQMQATTFALILASLPLILSIFGSWNRIKLKTILGVVIVLGIMIIIRAIPGQLDDGGWKTFTSYLTLGSTIKDKTSLDYLDKVYPAEAISVYWIYWLAIGTLASLYLLDERFPQARKVVLYGGLVFFGLFALSSILDGRAYFNAFVDVAKADGKPNYHFALFHRATDQFPDSSRVPLWMSDVLWTKSSLVLITMWSSGASMLIFLAALKGVPPVLYEAAEVDGASGVQKFFQITLPMISPAMFYNIVIGMIASLQTFESIYILRRPETESSLSSAAYFLFTRTFQDLQIGQGAAASWILAVIILTLTVMQFRYSKWVNYEV